MVRRRTRNVSASGDADITEGIKIIHALPTMREASQVVSPHNLKVLAKTLRSAMTPTNNRAPPSKRTLCEALASIHEEKPRISANWSKAAIAGAILTWVERASAMSNQMRQMRLFVKLKQSGASPSKVIASTYFGKDIRSPRNKRKASSEAELSPLEGNEPHNANSERGHDHEESASAQVSGPVDRARNALAATREERIQRILSQRFPGDVASSPPK